MALVLVVAAGCGGDDPSTDGGSTPTGGAPETTTETEVADGPGNTEVGDCIVLGGTASAATAEPADCAAEDATHVVVGAERSQDDCPGDVDAVYFEEQLSVDTLALCLDVNWQEGACFDFTSQDFSEISRVPCEPVPGRTIEQFESRLDGTVDPAGCPNGGFVYDQRQFVVCSLTLE